MKLKIPILIYFLNSSCLLISGQVWNKEDTIWLQNIFERKETLINNEDTKEAIKEDLFVITMWMKNPNSNKNLELNNDFYPIRTPDTSQIPSFDQTKKRRY